VVGSCCISIITIPHTFPPPPSPPLMVSPSTPTCFVPVKELPEHLLEANSLFWGAFLWPKPLPHLDCLLPMEVSNEAWFAFVHPGPPCPDLP
jgi:hypothetical protein